MLLSDFLQILEVPPDEDRSPFEGLKMKSGPLQCILVPIEAIEQPVGATPSQNPFGVPPQPNGSIQVATAGMGSEPVEDFFQ